MNSTDTAAPTPPQILRQRRPGYSAPPAFYQDPALYTLEMERIWRQGWIFAGHSCELPKAGDYITLTIDRTPVMVIRDDSGTLRAFHNVCRHRGTVLLSEPAGHVRKLVCPYHQWTYSCSGELLACHGMQPLDKGLLGLKPVAIEECEGLIFVSLAQRPAAFAPARELMAPFARPLQLGRCKIARTMDYEVAANWKLVWENNRECYHCNIGHPQYIRANYDIHEEALAAPAVLERIAAAGARSEAKWAERGLAATHREGGLAPFPDPANKVWYSANRTLLAEGFHTESMDGRRVAPLLPGYEDEDVGVVRMRTMPNFWNHSSCDHAVSTRLLPGGHQRTLVRIYWLVHQDAVEGVDYDCERLLPFWQLTGEQDWKLCERAQRGVNSSGYEPGPLSTLREYNVEALLQWYLQQMQEAPAVPA